MVNKVEQDIKALIQILESKYTSSKGFMGIEFDGVKSVGDLMENTRNEIFITNELLTYGDIEEEFGMTEREAKGYIKKLNNFIAKYE